MADDRVEHAAEIDEVYQDFAKAFNTKDNFINRGLEDLTGVINENLSIKGIYTNKKRLHLTESGTELPPADHYDLNKKISILGSNMASES